MPPTDTQDLDAWIGTERVQQDVVSLQAARALAATLDREADALKDGTPFPLGWHWILFNSVAPRSDLAPDGHARRGSILPPVPLPRRMWAGGALRFGGTLRIGEPIERVSTIQSIEHKEGRSGPLVFVTVRHEISNEVGVAVEEEQNLVYRTLESPDHATAPRTDPPNPPPADPDWTESFVADEVTLFRFSALTFNDHRIHYDYRYATDVEGYPGLVVHGPLLALLLVDAGVRHAVAATPYTTVATSFRYRNARPLFCNEEFQLGGGCLEDTGTGGQFAEDGHAGVGTVDGVARMKLWVAHPERGLAIEAELECVRTVERRPA